VNFIIGDPADINDFVGEVADLAGAAKVAQDIRDREAEIDAAQEPDIADVLEPAFGGYRQEFQLVAVVEDCGEIIGERAEDEVWGPVTTVSVFAFMRSVIAFKSGCGARALPWRRTAGSV
jgi:acyl-CoA reductase-like NAD-dependent aldehyde dehydrogenase